VSADPNRASQEEKMLDKGRVSDHLANERTFLAWLRTGIATMGFGILLAKLRYLLGNSQPISSGVLHASQIGLLLTILGLVIVGSSSYRYRTIHYQIRRNEYQSDLMMPLGLAFAVLIFGILIVMYLLQG
jgi:putative membrane protein